MDSPKHSADDPDENFDLDCESLTFSSVRIEGSDSVDEWEHRFNEDATGYVANSATTSFTDLDLGPALVDLRSSDEWADLSSWSED